MNDRPLHPGQLQNWQVIAIRRDGREMLVTLGVSVLDVKRRYFEQLAYLAGHHVVEVVLRKWDGDYCSGRWIPAGKLDVSKIAQEAQAA